MAARQLKNAAKKGPTAAVTAAAEVPANMAKALGTFGKALKQKAAMAKRLTAAAKAARLTAAKAAGKGVAKSVATTVRA